jgi:RNA polymerase sigma-70 factor (ECF subfamily)
MTELAWIDAALTAARPQAVGALLRWFRDLDTAEEAFQDACLRALGNWPEKGPPRDPAAWLIMVGRNAAIDQKRRAARQAPLPPEELISNLDDAEADLAERLDGADYRDDVLRLLFICCHPDLPATQQIPLALRIVCGLSVKQIARAFLIGEAAMEQRITRAKARIAQAGVAFDPPARSNGPNGSGPSRPWPIWCSTRVIRRSAPRPRPARRCATRRSGWPACCCGYSRPSRKSWA